MVIREDGQFEAGGRRDFMTGIVEGHGNEDEPRWIGREGSDAKAGAGRLGHEGPGVAVGAEADRGGIEGRAVGAKHDGRPVGVLSGATFGELEVQFGWDDRRRRGGVGGDGAMKSVAEGSGPGVGYGELA